VRSSPAEGSNGALLADLSDVRFRPIADIEKALRSIDLLRTRTGFDYPEVLARRTQ
jgi:hypothetical protein